MDFFNQLKKRNVIQVAISYLVVSWLLIQVFSVFTTSFEAPAWVMKSIITFFILLFPVVLVFSWFFEITAQGIKRETDIEHDDDSVKRRATRLNYVSLIGSIGLIALLSWYQFKPDVVENKASDAVTDSNQTNNNQAQNLLSGLTDAKSIAVLPFDDFSPDKDQQYFSDGIAEEILNVLARVDGLKVASRTSAFQYRDKNLSIGEIASQLKVKYVLEGSVRTAGDNVRITAQLIEAASDIHLWSENFDRELTVDNLFDIQDEIAAGIVSKLGINLENNRLESLKYLAAAETDDLNAYRRFLSARAMFSERTKDNIQLIIDDLETATKLDSNFAHAWQTMAATFVTASRFGYDRQESDKKSLYAANKANELAPHLALARTIKNLPLGKKGRRDLIASMQPFKEGYESDPNESIICNWYAQTSIMLGYFERGNAVLNQCINLDPTNTVLREFKYIVYVLTRNYDRAIEAYQSEYFSYPLNLSIAKYYIQKNKLASAKEFINASNEFTEYIDSWPYIY